MLWTHNDARVVVHTNNICHRDIKPENILVGEDYRFKLSDFGVAHMFDEGDMKKLKNTEGTYHFLAPECIAGEAFDPYKADVWSLGITMYATLFGIVPFGANETGIASVLEAIRSEPLQFHGDISEHGKDFLSRMLDRNPETRITVAQIKEHPWVQITQRTRGLSYPPLEAIEVSLEEINMAFTPINDLVLMVRRCS